MPRSSAGGVADDSDSDVPETVTLAQSKKQSKNLDAILQRVHAAEREKNRLRNKERDRKLQEQSLTSKKRRKVKMSEDDADVEARMERPMRELETEINHEEDNGEDGQVEVDLRKESEGNEEGGDSESEEGDEGGGGNEGEESDKDEEDYGSIDSTPSQSLSQPRLNLKHLPDHLFTSAFSEAARSRLTSKRKVKDEGDSTGIARKRVRKNASPKDILIGSRTVRTLSQDPHPSGAATIPSAKVRKFIDRTLALKGSGPRTRGWERRPANIGVMRRSGPAAGFVRNR